MTDSTPAPAAELMRFDNPKTARNYEIFFDCPEFTCLCPLTKQPDFAHIKITYTPDEHCIELKSLKLYLGAYRNMGAFHEKVTNTICDDIVAAIGPRVVEVEADFFVRGGIRTVVKARHVKGEDPDIALRSDISMRAK